MIGDDLPPEDSDFEEILEMHRRGVQMRENWVNWAINEAVKTADRDMQQFASDVTKSNRRADENVPYPKTPRIVSDYSETPVMPVKLAPPETTPIRITTPGPCPAATLECDSVAATKNKCGLPEYVGHISTPPKYYLQQDVTVTASATDHNEGTPSCHYDCSWSASTSRTDTLDPVTGCTDSCDSSGSGTYTFTGDNLDCYHDASGTSTAPCIVGWPYDFGGFSSPGSIFVADSYIRGLSGCNISLPANCSGSVASGSFIVDTSTEQKITFTGSGPGGGHTGSNSATADYKLSNEFTTDQLKTNTEDALTDNGNDCEAIYNLNDTETSFTLQRCTYRFTLGAAAGALMKVIWYELFIPTLTADVTFDGVDYHAGDPDPDPSHWTYTARSWIATGGEVVTDDFIIPDPTTNGTTTIVNISTDCSMVAGGDATQTILGEV